MRPDIARSRKLIIEDPFAALSDTKRKVWTGGSWAYPGAVGRLSALWRRAADRSRQGVVSHG